MKRFGIALGLAAMVVVPSAAMAQSEGAIVERGQEAYVIAMVEYGVNTLIVFSQYPDFACEGGEPVPFRWQVVTTPVYAQHYHDTEVMFARVYEVDDDALADFDADPEEFICGGEYLPWAEGVLSGMFYDNDMTVTAPGANVWGHVLNGMLTDLSGACKNGVVQVQVVHMLRIAPNADYPACWPGCLEFRAFKGPTAECIGKK